MKKFLVRAIQIIAAIVVILIVIGFFASSNEDKAIGATSKSDTKETTTSDTKNEAKKEAYSDAGVLTFNSAKDFFEYTNDWDLDDEIRILNDNPLNLKITPFSLSKDNVLDEINKEDFIKTVYQLFIHTDIDSLTLEMYPAIINNQRKVQEELSNLSIKGTITRDKALEVLKKHTGITKFGDLVATKKDDVSQYGTLGFERKKVFNDFIRKDENAVLNDLLDKPVKNTVINKKKVAEGVYDLETVKANINKNLKGIGYSIPKNLKALSGQESDVQEVASIDIRKGLNLTIIINKETQKVNGIRTIIGPKEAGNDIMEVLTASTMMLSSLDQKNYNVVSDKLAKATVEAIEEFSKSKKSITKDFSQNGLNYSISLSTELGVVISSAGYPQPK